MMDVNLPYTMRSNSSDAVSHRELDSGTPEHLVDSTILVVEDELGLRELLSRSLTSAGYPVLTAENGAEALKVLETQQVDLILLDIMMPIMDGLSTCEEIRRISNVPIVMLTALNRPDDVARGLELGADEYITKPFTFREMRVRIQALLRRVSWGQGIASLSVDTGDGILLDDETEEATVDGQIVQLTPIEYKFLRYLMVRPDQPVGKEDLLGSVWGYDENTNGSVIQSVVRRLRLKIEKDPAEPQYVVSVWGIGYKFQPQGQRADAQH